jgi:hypothetical protein
METCGPALEQQCNFGDWTPPATDKTRSGGESSLFAEETT